MNSEDSTDNPYESPILESEPVRARWDLRAFEIVAGILTAGFVLAGAAMVIRFMLGD